MSQQIEDYNNFIKLFDKLHSTMSSVLYNTPEEKQKRHANFRINIFKQYLDDKNKIIRGLLELVVPETIIDELSIIIKESRDFNVELSYPFSELDNVIEYISKQKLHLSSIKTKLGKDNRTYLRISSSVVEISIITIMCVLNEIESEFQAYDNDLNDLMVSYLLKQDNVKRQFEIAYNAINQLSSFDMEYGYNYNRFTPCKQDIEHSCLSKYAFRKPKSGCMSIVALLFVSSLTLFFM